MLIVLLLALAGAVSFTLSYRLTPMTPSKTGSFKASVKRALRSALLALALSLPWSFLIYRVMESTPTLFSREQYFMLQAFGANVISVAVLTGYVWRARKSR